MNAKGMLFGDDSQIFHSEWRSVCSLSSECVLHISTWFLALLFLHFDIYSLQVSLGSTHKWDKPVIAEVPFGTGLQLYNQWNGMTVFLSFPRKPVKQLRIHSSTDKQDIMKDFFLKYKNIQYVWYYYANIYLVWCTAV